MKFLGSLTLFSDPPQNLIILRVVACLNHSCLLVESVSLWQHVCASLSASVSKVLKSHLPTISSSLNTLFTLTEHLYLIYERLLNKVAEKHYMIYKLLSNSYSSYWISKYYTFFFSLYG